MWTSPSFHTSSQPRGAEQDLFQRRQIAVLKKLEVAQEKGDVPEWNLTHPLADQQTLGESQRQAQPLVPCSGSGMQWQEQSWLLQGGSGCHGDRKPLQMVPTSRIPLGAALRPHILGSCATGETGLCFKNKCPPRIWLFSDSKQRKHGQAQISLAEREHNPFYSAGKPINHCHPSSSLPSARVRGSLVLWGHNKGHKGCQENAARTIPAPFQRVSYVLGKGTKAFLPSLLFQ